MLLTFVANQKEQKEMVIDQKEQLARLKELSYRLNHIEIPVDFYDSLMERALKYDKIMEGLGLARKGTLRD